MVETAQAFSTHHAAMLIGYGAHALCPYLAYETARQWRLSSRTQSLVKSGKVGGAWGRGGGCYTLTADGSALVWVLHSWLRVYCPFSRRTSAM